MHSLWLSAKFVHIIACFCLTSTSAKLECARKGSRRSTIRMLHANELPNLFVDRAFHLFQGILIQNRSVRAAKNFAVHCCPDAALWSASAAVQVSVWLSSLRTPPWEFFCSLEHYIFLLAPLTHSSQVCSGAMMHHTPQGLASAPPTLLLLSSCSCVLRRARCPCHMMRL